jgi:hypothetical protein
MSIDKYTEKSNLNETVQLMSLHDVATMLSVSTATVRNWMKAGKLRKVNSEERIPFFNRMEILTYKEEIESGASHRLKSRRNKRAIMGHSVPIEYVNSAKYIELTEKILEIISKATVWIEPQFILFEISLCLFYDRGVLQGEECKNRDIIGDEGDITVSFTEQVIRGRRDLGIYEELLIELWDFREFGTQEKKVQQEAYEVLRAIRQLEIHYFRGDDLLGLVYMALSKLGARKSRGSYYTPSKLVNQLVQQSLDSLGNVLFPKVIDPCCGSGNFLIQLFIALVERAEGSGFPRKEAEMQVVETVLYGYDIDPIAVSLTKINIVLLLERLFENKEDDISSVIKLLDSHIIEKNTLESYGKLAEVSNPEAYDLVIGNPPWGSRLTKDEIETYREKYVSGETALDSFSLFIEYGLSILDDKGLLAFVLPEALLNVQIHSPIRKRLLDETEIIQINVLGHQFTQVFTPTITILARRSKKGNIHQGNNHVQIHLEGEIHTIPQERFLSNTMYIFNVEASNQEQDILEYMKTLPGAQYLAGNAEFALGIVTGNNKEFILNQPVEGAEPVLKGNDIFKYNYQSKDNYLIFKPEKFQQVAPIPLYRAPEKLIYRFINENLVFAYDDRQTLSLNSANIMIPRLSGYSVKYILAVLNSRAAQFFYAASFSSVKILRKHIESVPIPQSNSTTQQRIVELVDRLMHTSENPHRTELYEQIDEEIMGLYTLNTKQKEHIRRRFEVIKYLTKS